MQPTSIQWTDFSANMLKYRDEATNKVVWACVKVSDGCKNCYAESTAKRWNRGGPFSLPVMKKTTPYFCDEEAGKILRSKKLAGKRVFVDDMTDWAGEWVTDEIIIKHLAVYALRPDVVFQCLTKRAERLARLLNDPQIPNLIYRQITRWLDHEDDSPLGSGATWEAAHRLAEWRGDGGTVDECKWTWPLPNVWLGYSAENQQRLDWGTPFLLRCPAAVRFLSCEPLLEGVDLRKYIGYNPMYENTIQRSGVVQSGPNGAFQNRPRWNSVEGGRTSRQPLESSGITATDHAKASRKCDSGAVHAGEVDERGNADSLSCASAGVAPLSGADFRGIPDQPSERGQTGQPIRKSGVGDSQQQQETCVSDRNGGRTRTEESGGETLGLSSGRDSHDVSNRSENTETDCESIRRVASAGVEDCSRKQAKKTERADCGLHIKTLPGAEGKITDGPIHLVIVGGESGSKARPFDVAWARSIIGQCEAAGVACFVKQLGAKPGHTAHKQPLSGAWIDWPLKDSHGGDPLEWPADLRVREFPSPLSAAPDPGGAK